MWNQDSQAETMESSFSDAIFTVNWKKKCMCAWECTHPSMWVSVYMCTHIHIISLLMWTGGQAQVWWQIPLLTELSHCHRPTVSSFWFPESFQVGSTDNQQNTKRPRDWSLITWNVLTPCPFSIEDFLRSCQVRSCSCLPVRNTLPVSRQHQGEWDMCTVVKSRGCSFWSLFRCCFLGHLTYLIFGSSSLSSCPLQCSAVPALSPLRAGTCGCHLCLSIYHSFWPTVTVDLRQCCLSAEPVQQWLPPTAPFLCCPFLLLVLVGRRKICARSLSLPGLSLRFLLPLSLLLLLMETHRDWPTLRHSPLHFHAPFNLYLFLC